MYFYVTQTVLVFLTVDSFSRLYPYAVACDVSLSPHQAIMILSVLMFVTYYWKRSKWTVLKSRKVVYHDKGS